MSELLSMILQKTESSRKINEISDQNCTLYLMAQASIARKTFLKDGKLVIYKNCEGQEIVFTPSQEDITSFKERVRAFTLLEDAKSSIPKLLLEWLFIISISMIFGFRSCRKSQNKKFI